MPASASMEDFLRSTESVSTDIADEVEAPLAIPGMPEPIDPMKPWLNINVDAYMPLVKWGVKQPFGFAARKYDPLWEIDEDEVDSISPALKEATQRCLYDLNLSQVAGNPYVALVLSLGGLAMAKLMSIKVVRLMEEASQKEADQQGRGPRILPQNPSTPPANRPQSKPARSNRPGTRRASSTTNGRMPESVDVSSSAGFRAPENLSSWSTEFDTDDE